ncbi:dihydroxyacetone kinase phosphoryl donor subunit DhaM [Bogoriella caseilytica]|uniref:Phosphocarrier protein HPr n=1 Tax=Bogoriella caseilytica TaxID=56055 RepID=A0A3N2BFC7_9MICO|nr:dihydroxyacetone kinase phosphoryl donor subunit DhaM [Bogoriella caseilytica]ROR73961.1 phosphocarrier protein HPr /dihydroxyacetone kinase DhaM subunit [Bogoriella caseilytica]
MNSPGARDITTALVIVAHSAQLAEGVCEVAAQMAPDVTVRAAGGTEDGRVGTSIPRVEAAIRTLLDEGFGVVVLTDLGSAVMAAETAKELIDEDSRVTVVDGPLIEGSVAAAVAAQNGYSHRQAARGATGPDPRHIASAATPEIAAAPVSEVEVREFTLVNEVGLHARPAALLARTIAGFDAEVLVDDVDGASVLSLMSLGRTQGQTIRVTASGPGASLALDAVAALIESGFGEGSGR